MVLNEKRLEEDFILDELCWNQHFEAWMEKDKIKKVNDKDKSEFCLILYKVEKDSIWCMLMWYYSNLSQSIYKHAIDIL